MQIFDGRPLDARFTVETLDGTQTVVLQSRGGGAPPRNTEYNAGLLVLLQRLAALRAILNGAVVDTRETQRAGLSRDDRLLDPGAGRSYPLRLARDPDLEELRLALGRSQAAVRITPGTAGGNPTKQIRLYVDLPAPGLADEELERVLGAGARLLVVALPHSARKNLEWGLENGIWGFPVPRHRVTEAERVADYKRLRRGDPVLILSGYDGGTPRVDEAKWAGEAAAGFHSFADCYLCTVNEPYYRDTAPFWPNELHLTASRYPHRIGIDPVAIGAISLESGRDVSADVIAAARRSHTQGAQGFVADALGSPRLAVVAGAEEPEQTAEQPEDMTPPETGGQGRSLDPIRRRRTEERAVALARTHYEKGGWTVKDVSRRNEETQGTPYDLRCTKGKLVRHVEVKGATRSAETVHVTANERTHAGANTDPAESYLFVVEQIGLKTRNGEVRAVGGVVRYHGPFLVDEERFIPTQYRYTVPQAQASDDGRPSTGEQAVETQP